MQSSRRADHQPVDTVRRLVTFGFWLLAACAAATLGLDLDGDSHL
jgi:hypothetical protein